MAERAAPPAPDSETPRRLDDRRAARRRRIILPLLTLLVAGAIFYVQRRQASQRDVEVRRAVEALVADANSGRAPAAGGRLAAAAGTEPVIASAVRTQLTALARDAERAGAPLSVAVFRGDLPDADGAATHTASVSLDAGRRLVLRVLHDGAEEEMAIIGVTVHGGRDGSEESAAGGASAGRFRRAGVIATFRAA